MTESLFFGDPFAVPPSYHLCRVQVMDQPCMTPANVSSIDRPLRGAQAELLLACAAEISPISDGDRQRDQLLRRVVEAVEVTTGVDEFGELRLADREAGGDGADAPGFFLEIPDEFATGAFFRKIAAVLGEHCDPRAKEGAAHRRDQGYAMHQVEDGGRVGFAGAGPVAAQQGIAALDSAPSGEILRAAHLRRAVDAAAGKGRTRILGLEPVDESLDPVDVLVTDIVLATQLRGYIDVGDVVAGGRIDPVQRLEKDPVAAKAFGDLANVG